MYIEPNTTIRILRNCPLDNTFEHTIYFALEPEQEAYFKKLTKYTLTRQSYQRVNAGVMRVGIKAESLYDCNYLMFQNESFGDKWFYAFIKSVEYVNNITSEITFELDPMQTWFFNYDLGQCFVEREHTLTDKIGDNIIDEGLSCGDYMIKAESSNVWGNELSIIILASFDKNFEDTEGAKYNGFFSGLYCNRFNNDGEGSIEARNFISQAAEKNKLDGIVGVGIMPTRFFSEAGIFEKDGNLVSYDITVTKKYPNVRQNGKPPKNNKMHVYPYNFLEVSNNINDSKIYKYEFFSDTGCGFKIYGETGLNPSLMLVPTNYKSTYLDFPDALTMNGFPLIPWSGDAYKAWLAQTSSSNSVSALSSVGSLAVGAAAATLNPVAGGVMMAGSLISAATQIGGLLAERNVQSQKANTPHNSQSNYIMAGSGHSDYLLIYKYLTPEYVDIIDDYFNVFGYACRQVKVPNRNARPHWTYTKTMNCVLTGSLPCDDANKICNIYNNGITFWRNGDEVGNYNLDNSPEES